MQTVHTCTVLYCTVPPHPVRTLSRYIQSPYLDSQPTNLQVLWCILCLCAPTVTITISKSQNEIKNVGLYKYIRQPQNEQGPLMKNLSTANTNHANFNMKNILSMGDAVYTYTVDSVLLVHIRSRVF